MRLGSVRKGWVDKRWGSVSKGWVRLLLSWERCNETNSMCMAKDL